MAGCLLFRSPSEHSELDFKCNTSALSILSWIYGWTGAPCSAEGNAKVCFEEAEEGFPQTNYQQILN